VVRLLAPPSASFERGGSDLVAGQMGRVFDPVVAAGVAARAVTEPLFEPARLNRVGYAREAEGAPAVADVVAACVAATREEGPAGVAAEARRAILGSALAARRSNKLHVTVAVELRAALDALTEELPAGEAAILRRALDGQETLLDIQPTLPDGVPL
jgi:hypothetical protein